MLWTLHISFVTSFTTCLTISHQPTAGCKLSVDRRSQRRRPTSGQPVPIRRWRCKLRQWPGTVFGGFCHNFDDFIFHPMKYPIWELYPMTGMYLNQLYQIYHFFIQLYPMTGMMNTFMTGNIFQLGALALQKGNDHRLVSSDARATSKQRMGPIRAWQEWNWLVASLPIENAHF